MTIPGRPRRSGGSGMSFRFTSLMFLSIRGSQRTLRNAAAREFSKPSAKQRRDERKSSRPCLADVFENLEVLFRFVSLMFLDAVKATQ